MFLHIIFVEPGLAVNSQATKRMRQELEEAVTGCDQQLFPEVAMATAVLRSSVLFAAQHLHICYTYI